MRSLSIVLASAVLVLTAPVAAVGAELRIYDPAKDGAKGSSLDVTRVKIVNGDEIQVIVTFEKADTGDLVVFLKFEGKRGYIRAVSKFRPEKKNSVRDFLFGSPHGPDPKPCPDFFTAWRTQTSPSSGRAKMTIPSTCLYNNNYDKVKVKVMTKAGAATVDLAPNPRPRFRYSRYVSRG